MGIVMWIETNVDFVVDERNTRAAIPAIRWSHWSARTCCLWERDQCQIAMKQGERIKGPAAGEPDEIPID